MNSVEFTEKIKSVTGRELNHELDIEKILFRLNEPEKFQKIEDLAFLAKYIKGLMKVSQNALDQSDDYKNMITSDLAEAVNKFKEKIKSVTDEYPKEEKDSFYLRFLSMNQMAFANLVALINDFETVKIYLNIKKRNKQE